MLRYKISLLVLIKVGCIYPHMTCCTAVVHEATVLSLLDCGKGGEVELWSSGVNRSASLTCPPICAMMEWRRKKVDKLCCSP